MNYCCLPEFGVGDCDGESADEHPVELHMDGSNIEIMTLDDTFTEVSTSESLFSLIE